MFSPSQGGLLGAGTGAGSCAAAPYRSSSVYWIGGCPKYAECCTEFGYCHDRVSLGWLLFNPLNSPNSRLAGIVKPTSEIVMVRAMVFRFLLRF